MACCDGTGMQKKVVQKLDPRCNGAVIPSEFLPTYSVLQSSARSEETEAAVAFTPLPRNMCTTGPLARGLQKQSPPVHQKSELHDDGSLVFARPLQPAATCSIPHPTPMMTQSSA